MRQVLTGDAPLGWTTRSLQTSRLCRLSGFMSGFRIARLPSAPGAPPLSDVQALTVGCAVAAVTRLRLQAACVAARRPSSSDDSKEPGGDAIRHGSTGPAQAAQGQAAESDEEPSPTYSPESPDEVSSPNYSPESPAEWSDDSPTRSPRPPCSPESPTEPAATAPLQQPHAADSPAYSPERTEGPSSRTFTLEDAALAETIAGD